MSRIDEKIKKHMKKPRKKSKIDMVCNKCGNKFKSKRTDLEGAGTYCPKCHSISLKRADGGDL